jgi:hypothetical protein
LVENASWVDRVGLRKEARMRIAPRLIAIAVISAPLALWKTGRETAEMERLRSLSHDALLAYLQEHHKGSFGTAYISAVILLVVAFLVVHAGGIAIERLMPFRGGSTKT